MVFLLLTAYNLIASAGINLRENTFDQDPFDETCPGSGACP
jgi:hypothetical protein